MPIKIQIERKIREKKNKEYKNGNGNGLTWELYIERRKDEGGIEREENIYDYAFYTHKKQKK